MRKRLLAFLTSAALLFSLAACGAETPKWEPERASAEIEPYARRAIEIIDGYLNFTMTVDEATEAFGDLDDRISPFNVTDIDSEYSDPDRTIAHSITMLSIGNADYRTDLEYREYRDMIAFQIGEKVSGKSYEPERLGKDWDEEGFATTLGLYELPVSSADYYAGETLCSVSVSFDYINGVSIADIYNYIDSILKTSKQISVPIDYIHFSYACYGQGVIFGSLYFFDDFYGRISRSDSEAMAAYFRLKDKYTDEEIAEMEEYPKDFAILNPLYEFDSIEDLPEALAVASAFAGIE